MRPLSKRKWRSGLVALRADWLPGVLAALLTLPQAIALATLAGMPVEHGLYLSLLPALAATLFGQSRVALSGPNTATSILLYASATAFATPGSPDYVNQVLLTTLCASIFQMLLFLLRAGKLLLDLPLSVTQGIVVGTGILILSQQAGPLLGVAVNGAGPIEAVGQALFHDAKNFWPLAVGGFAVACGWLTKYRGHNRYSLLLALLGGWLATELADLLFGSAVTGLERLGQIRLSLSFFSLPNFERGELAALFAALRDGLVIAAIGALQTTIMARTISVMTGRRLSLNRDLLGQSLMNFIAAFTSGLAGATSFNRTLANLEAGARGRAAGIVCVAVLACGIAIGQDWLARIPLAAVAGVLVLVGYSLLGGLRNIDFANRRQTLELAATVAAAIFLGLFSAVLVGACLTLYHRALDHESD